MLSPALTSWTTQYERMLRTYARLKESYVSSVAYDDDLQHFFQDCWHLKDWIKNDPTLAAQSIPIEATVDARKPLRIAADLANACKHLDRHQHREGAYVTSKSVTVHLGQNRGVDVLHVITLSDGSTLPADVAAEQAIDAWEAVLRDLGLK